jgi:hypothetical protein
MSAFQSSLYSGMVFTSIPVIKICLLLFQIINVCVISHQKQSFFFCLLHVFWPERFVRWLMTCVCGIRVCFFACVVMVEMSFS